MKQTQSKQAPSFMTKNKDVFVIGGVLVVLAAVGVTYYLVKRKKEKKADLAGVDTTVATIDVSNTTSSNPTKPIATKKGYPIKYGSRNQDVKILQQYLKIYKEDLGRSGSKRDGVDGIFGPKTSRAAKKRLGKTAFTKADIEGMRKALISLGKL